MTGCSAKVSINNLGTNGNFKVETVNVRGTSRGLEKEAMRLASQMTGDPDADSTSWRKIEEIRDTLLIRGYLVKQSYIMPTIQYSQDATDKLGKKLQAFQPDKMSPLALVSAGPATGDGSIKGPILVTITDHKRNIEKWHHFLLTIDTQISPVESDSSYDTNKTYQIKAAPPSSQQTQQ
jgi:hypothetical protein